MDAQRQNSPSRKSRFRAHGTSSYRNAVPAEESDPGTLEETEADPAEEVLSEQPPSETDPSAAPGEDSPASEESLPGELSSEDPAAATPEEELPAGLRLTRSADNIAERSRRPSWRPILLTALVCLAVGGTGGYLLRARKSGVVLDADGLAASPQSVAPTVALNPNVLAEVDAAFDANKQGKFADARAAFTRLAEQHRGWSSMRIEAARSALYDHDFEGAEKILATLLRAGPNADAEFLSGLLQMTLQAYDKSEAAFGRAIALDPSRPDIFYFWGECLRREGKPQDAAEKFRQATIRNQYETTEGLYQLKLWLSEIQADQEAAKGSNARIDAELATNHPSGPALLAAAARHIKAGQFKEAGERIAQAQKVMEPAVFHVILQDPLFLQENYRAEFAPFYK